MKVYRLYRRQSLAVSLPEAWDFFTSPYRLNDITPDFFRIELTSPVPAQLYAGLMIRYNMTAVFGVPMTWVSEISHYQQHKRFVYDQRAGPFKFLTHEVCLSEEQGAVIVEDILFYAMPFGLFGRLMHRLLIESRLKQIFDRRRDYLQQHWGSRDD